MLMTGVCLSAKASIHDCHIGKGDKNIQKERKTSICEATPEPPGVASQQEPSPQPPPLLIGFLWVAPQGSHPAWLREGLQERQLMSLRFTKKDTAAMHDTSL